MRKCKTARSRVDRKSFSEEGFSTHGDGCEALQANFELR